MAGSLFSPDELQLFCLVSKKDQTSFVIIQHKLEIFRLDRIFIREVWYAKDHRHNLPYHTMQKEFKQVVPGGAAHILDSTCETDKQGVPWWCTSSFILPVKQM